MTDHNPAPQGASAGRHEGDTTPTWGDAVSRDAAWTEILPGRWTDILSREVDDEIRGEAA